jgi:DNA-binding response OmpR family regulator
MYIIDDEPEVVEILVDFIKKNGVLVKSFYNAEDALAEIEDDNPDAVLIDITC